MRSRSRRATDLPPTTRWDSKRRWKEPLTAKDAEENLVRFLCVLCGLSLRPLRSKAFLLGPIPGNSTHRHPGSVLPARVLLRCAVTGYTSPPDPYAKPNLS